MYLRHLSSSAYEMVRTTGLLRLPSQRTLRDYTYYTQSCSSTVDQQLCKAAQIDSCRLMEKYVILIMDEMHIREDLDKQTGICHAKSREIIKVIISYFYQVVFYIMSFLWPKQACTHVDEKFLSLKKKNPAKKVFFKNLEHWNLSASLGLYLYMAPGGNKGEGVSSAVLSIMGGAAPS